MRGLMDNEDDEDEDELMLNACWIVYRCRWRIKQRQKLMRFLYWLYFLLGAEGGKYVFIYLVNTAIITHKQSFTDLLKSNKTYLMRSMTCEWAVLALKTAIFITYNQIYKWIKGHVDETHTVRVECAIAVKWFSSTRRLTLSVNSAQTHLEGVFRHSSCSDQ